MNRMLELMCMSGRQLKEKSLKPSHDRMIKVTNFNFKEMCLFLMMII